MLFALALAAAPATFDPLRFFAGRTQGVGRLHVVLRHPRAVQVHGVGRARPDGTLQLTQRVEQEGKAATTRSWLLHRVGPGRWAGTLTDARGPVSAQATGDRLRIRYRAAGKVDIEQWLTLAADGRSATNRLTARRLGVVVARLDEVITKGD